jgi:uncharacterized protein (DUF433 family)
MTALECKKPGLGTGIYTCSDAAFLLQASSQKIAQWARGYVRVVRGDKYMVPGVLPAAAGGTRLLTFADVIELKYISYFRSCKVPIKEIRQASETLSQRFETAYPFAQKRCMLAGTELIFEENGKYLAAGNLQHILGIVNGFIDDIDFNDLEALRWWPMGRDVDIVVDPLKCYGAPTIKGHRLSTENIYRLYIAEEKNIESVTQWYDITVQQAEDAVRFEEKWRDLKST